MLKSFANESRSFKYHYETHILGKIKSELEGRYSVEEVAEDVQRERLYEKLTIPYIDFSITTRCSLKCRDCGQWCAYLRQRTPSKEEIFTWLEQMFRFVDHVSFLTILGGGATDTP